MIKVLHVVNKMNRGGIETFIMNVYRNINRKKIQFDFLVHTDKKGDFDDEIAALGGMIYKIPPRKSGFLKNRKSLNNFFKTHTEYNILHQHVSSLSYIEPLKSAEKHRLPIRIVHSHSTQEGGSFIHNYIHKWNQIFIKSYATHFFACSDFAGEWLYGTKRDKVNSFEIINNGIQTSKFLFNEEKREKVRANLGIHDKFVIGHVGRLSYPKNHSFLIDIFIEVNKILPNSVLLLVGDGELRQEIEQKIDEMNLENRVILTGMRDDITDLLQAIDVFVFPSRFEGLPVTLVEAQASGLPCIVSDNITKQVEITDNIIYIDLTSPISEWVDKIIEVKIKHVRQDESQKIISAGFDIEIVTQQLQDFYINCDPLSRERS